MNPFTYEYPSRRSLVYGKKGMVCTSQPLAAQAGLDAPRWQWIREKVVEVEPDFPEALADSLKERGHEVIRKENKLDFGRGQIIQRTHSKECREMRMLL